MTNGNSDIFYKKTIPFSYKGHDLKFHVSQLLFSSQDIDIGTRRLLQTLASENYPYSKVLDLGAGYGPIGIALKSANPGSIVHMIDRDALAIDYSGKNSTLNNVETSVYASLGYDQVVETDFDLVVSNIPAKVGEPVLAYILKEAQFYLKPDGEVAIVVIEAIADCIKQTLFGLGVNIVFQKKWPSHSVFHYKFSSDTLVPKSDDSSFDQGIYDRENKIFQINNRIISLRTAYGLAEFDTLSYETQMIIDVLNMLKGRKMNNALVFNPVQGALPAALVQSSDVGRIVLIDRDMLALEVSRRNLVRNGFARNSISIYHQVDLAGIGTDNIDCVIGVLDKKDGPDVHTVFLKQAREQLSSEGLIILASASTPITRIEKIAHSDKSLKKLGRKKSKGKSVLILKKV